MMEPTETALAIACRAIDPEPIAALTLDLARMWSPPGREAKVAQRVADELDAVGVRVRIDREFPDSPSVIAELGADDGPTMRRHGHRADDGPTMQRHGHRAADGPTMQWHGHLDAIDVAHPEPYRTADRLHGRGTADMKGSVAAMVAAARLLVEHGLPSRGRVLITLHGMHESGGNEPLHRLIQRGIHGDAVITGELGGGRELPIAGLGLSFWQAEVNRPGAGMHENSRGPDTIDPLEVGRLLHAELAELRDKLAAIPGEEPRPSLFVATFQSGDYFNRVPVSAHLSGTRRFDTTTDPASVTEELRELADRVRQRTGAQIELSVVEVADSFAIDPGEPIVAATRAAHRSLTGTDLPVSRSRLATNAVHFVREAGIPAVGYGPDPATNHSDDESIAIAELPRIAGCFALASESYLATAGGSRR